MSDKKYALIFWMTLVGTIALVQANNMGAISDQAFQRLALIPIAVITYARWRVYQK